MAQFTKGVFLMKYRIKRIITPNKADVFVPQFRYYGRWLAFEGAFTFSELTFSTYEEAVYRIRKQQDLYKTRVIYCPIPEVD